MEFTVHHALYAASALFMWWLGTGVVFFIGGLSRHTNFLSLGLATLAALLALYGVAVSGTMETVVGAYLGFVSAIVLWGWQELTFLLGYITGPRKEVCPEDAEGWNRFWLATKTLLHHEIAIVLTGVAIAYVSWDHPNMIGFWTFFLLWIMRISSKLNIFLGVANLGQELLPNKLAYLSSYFGKQKLNLLFPISVTLSILVIAIFCHIAFSANARPDEIAGFSLLATLAFLGLVEHWLMILPVKDTALWTWAFQTKKAAAERNLEAVLPDTQRAGNVRLATVPASSNTTRGG